MSKLHDGPSGGHFGVDTTAHKLLKEGYYWPELFTDAHYYIRTYFIYQTCAGRERKPANPLEPVTIDGHFQQWGIDVIGEIKLHSSMEHKYILTIKDYFTRWVEVAPLKKISTNRVIDFLEHNIVTRFGTPLTLVFDNSSYFYSYALSQFLLD